ncbi:MAG: hypothetical protein J7J76_06305, partial [Candidatus Latescibacteria bacterium]|nr:hypothetical protein [Candidatus Latescibacterota bacterium]
VEPSASSVKSPFFSRIWARDGTTFRGVFSESGLKNSGSQLNSADISIVAEKATDRAYPSSFPTDSLGSACHHGSR